MLDRDDGKLLKAFGQEDSSMRTPTTGKKASTYRNTELRIRSVFAKADAVVLSGSESNKDEPYSQAHVFAWDVLSGEVIAAIPAGERVKAVSSVAWNEKGKCWASGCSDGMYFLFLAFQTR
jgi:mitogen-activated protein kinase organizer 1